MIRLHEQPVIGMWYWDFLLKKNFEVVALDEREGTVEIQYFEGEVEELEHDMWYQRRVVAVPPPEDWSGPYEVDKEEFYLLKNEENHPESWDSPLNSV
jgi:hypothetical protein